MRMVDLILKKRAGERLLPAEIQWMIQGFVQGSVPDYQMAAMMMAVFFQGMDPAETSELVRAMIASGDTIDLSAIRGTKVDKHSTGGVGDKTSIVLGPMVAATGVPLAKMSGRGLGHTGGTLDKLESFPGFTVELSMERFIQNVNTCGIAIAGQSANLVPADKQLYALRDVTGTVENLSLIAGSIMSKKLASGADAIVLDVKTGSGAFMKTEEEAFNLAREMVRIGKELGKQTEALVTSMEQPLGLTVGNALEVREAIEALRGEGPADLMELCMALGAEMVVLGGKAASLEEAHAKLEGVIRDGSALERLASMVEAQGGDASAVYDTALLPQAAEQITVRSARTGYVNGLEAHDIGLVSMLLGAGRVTKDSPIDLAAGVELRKKLGDHVEAGEPLAILHASGSNEWEAAIETLKGAYQIEPAKKPIAPLLRGKVE